MEFLVGLCQEVNYFLALQLYFEILGEKLPADKNKQKAAQNI